MKKKISLTKRKRFTLIDIHRILITYFTRDERVALMLDIMENDLKLNVTEILKQ